MRFSSGLDQLIGSCQARKDAAVRAGSCKRHSRSDNVCTSGEMLERDRDVNVPWCGTRRPRISAATYHGMPPVSFTKQCRFFPRIAYSLARDYLIANVYVQLGGSMSTSFFLLLAKRCISRKSNLETR